MRESKQNMIAISKSANAKVTSSGGVVPFYPIPSLLLTLHFRSTYSFILPFPFNSPHPLGTSHSFPYLSSRNVLRTNLPPTAFLRLFARFGHTSKCSTFAIPNPCLNCLDRTNCACWIRSLVGSEQSGRWRY